MIHLALPHQDRMYLLPGIFRACSTQLPNIILQSAALFGNPLVQRDRTPSPLCSPLQEYSTTSLSWAFSPEDTMGWDLPSDSEPLSVTSLLGWLLWSLFGSSTQRLTWICGLRSDVEFPDKSNQGMTQDCHLGARLFRFLGLIGNTGSWPSASSCDHSVVLGGGFPDPPSLRTQHSNSCKPCTPFLLPWSYTTMAPSTPR